MGGVTGEEEEEVGQHAGGGPDLVKLQLRVQHKGERLGGGVEEPGGTRSSI